MKREEKQKARQLREQGFSLREISKTLGVSKGSVSLWVRDINLTDDQRKKLFTNQIKSLINFGYDTSIEFREKRRQFQLGGEIKAKENDADHKAMCMLYWAEGSKSKNQVVFTNSDVYMMQYFIKLFKRYFDLKDQDIKIRIKTHIDNGLKLNDIEDYWLKSLELPRECLGKSFVDYRKADRNKDFKKRKLYYGVCAFIVNRTEIIQHIYGAIQEYANFKNDEWLNKHAAVEKLVNLAGLSLPMT